AVTTFVAPDRLGDLDVLSMVGYAPGVEPTASSERERAEFVLTVDRLARLAGDAVVLSPLPVVDEIADDIPTDARIRIWSQSDDAVFVRMAVLEMVSNWSADTPSR